MPSHKRPQRAITLEKASLLEAGDIRVLGRMPNSSNGTFLTEVTLEEERCLAIYKPERGERPLWDFPGALYRREVAAHHISQALHLDVVPPTLERFDLPYGIGSLQLFIEADFSRHYFDLIEDESYHPQLVNIAAFDLVCNNSDRKGGHVLVDEEGALWAIDNGLCFHAEWKLRTVIWELGGSPLNADLLERLAFLAENTPISMRTLLTEEETDALRFRASALAEAGKLPQVHPDHRHYPWPVI